MGDIVSDPTTLTKDKLKKELSRLNVQLPPSDSRKDVYVELYRAHVLPLLTKQVSEFSSDEEIVITKTQSKSPRKKITSPKKSPKKNATKDSKEEMDVTELSDEELSRRLRELGVEIGPIVDTTRRLYQKKLVKLLAEGVSAEGPHRTTVIEETATSQQETDTQIITETYTESQTYTDTQSSMAFSDSDDDVKPVSAPEPEVIPVKQSNIRQRPPVHSAKGTPRKYDRIDGENDRDQTTVKTFTSSSVTHTENSSTKVSAVTAEPQKKKGFSIITQLLIFLAVAALVYVFMCSIDSKPVNQIPSSA